MPSGGHGRPRPRTDVEIANYLTAGTVTIHDLKTHEGPFQAIMDELKRFEWRSTADRHFELGDLLRLREWAMPGKGGNRFYTGRIILAVVKYIAKGEFEIPLGFAVMSIEVVGSSDLRNDEDYDQDEAMTDHV